MILSFYLRANRHANMLGLYRLVLGDVLRELPVLGALVAVRSAFVALDTARWATYDDGSAFVWVRTMALERLGLANADQVLDPEDKRRLGAQRLYDTLPPNPFLEPFFQVYGRTLRLERRTFAQPLLDVSPADVTRVSAEGASQGASEGASQGASQAPSAGTSTYVPDLLISSDQKDQIDQKDRTAAAHAPRLPMPLAVTTPPSRSANELARESSGSNYHVIARAARELLHDRDLAAKYLEGPIERLTDLEEATKRFCARHKIDYGRHESVPFDVVHRACASEWIKFTSPGRIAGDDARLRDLRTNPYETTRGTRRRS